MKAKQQTSDPGKNHAVRGKNGGDADFSGQDDYDTGGGEMRAGDDTEVPCRVTNTSNKFNGSGGSRKTISPNKVKGSNP